MNVSTVGFDGGNITFIDTLLTLSGDYNASNLAGGTSFGETIITNYTDCQSDFTQGVFSPARTLESACAAPGINNWNCTTLAGFNNLGCWSLGRVPGPGDSLVFNGTGIGDVNITNNTMPHNLPLIVQYLQLNSYLRARYY